MPITTRPDLTARQIAWQNWRNLQFEELTNEQRFVGNNARANERKQGTRYAAHDNDLLSREIESLNQLETRYQLITRLDTATKNAYWRGTETEWEVALSNAERIMQNETAKI